MKPQRSTIDVIIPAYNEEKHIKDCLYALTHQTYTGSYRIIVIDNNSTDNTKKIASSFPGVLVKSEKKKGYVFAVKSGVETYATADIIAQTDADTVVSSTWLEAIYTHFKSNPSLIASGGPFYYSDGPKLLRSVVNTLNFIYPRVFSLYLCGMNMAYRRSAYDHVGGYDTRFNLQADGQLGMKLMRSGYVTFYRDQYVYSSARRFSTLPRFFKDFSMQFINLLSMALRNKPAYFSYTDYRN